MFNLSQKVSSPSPDAPECSSPIVVSEKSVALPRLGDWEVGSGEVPQDELGPWLEFDEAEGELYDVLWPVLPLPFAESVFNLDALELFLLTPLFEKNSKGGLFPTLSRSEGLKRPDRLDISAPSSDAGVCIKPVYGID